MPTDVVGKGVNTEKLKEMYLDLLRQTKREGIEDLIAYLENSDFFEAPASTIYHGSFPGGLVLHSLNVYNALQFHYGNLKASNEFSFPDIPEDSMIIVALCHDLCKVNTYHPTWRNKKVYSDRGSKQDAGGRFDWEVVQSYERKPLFAMGHGGKSVFILQQFIHVTPTEAAAIFWHMGPYDISAYTTLNELGQTYTDNLLAFLLYQADMTSTYIHENENYALYK